MLVFTVTELAVPFQIFIEFEVKGWSQQHLLPALSHASWLHVAIWFICWC